MREKNERRRGGSGARIRGSDREPSRRVRDAPRGVRHCRKTPGSIAAHGASFDQEHRIFDHTRPRDFYHVDTPLSLVRFFRTAQGMPEVNELFDAYLQHYWRLRVKLRVFGPISEHLLDLHVAPFLIGDGVLKKRSPA